MTNAELIAKIKAEIDKLYGEYKDKFHQCGDQYHLGLYDGLDMAKRVLDSLESEKPINPEEAMKELDEKIALVKQRGTWDGVDVDKYIDEVRGREPEKPNDLEEAAEKHLDTMFGRGKHQPFYKDLFIAGAKWQKEQMLMEAAEGEVVKDINNKLVVTAKNVNLDGFKFGEKVRIIIVKEDEK